MRPHIFDEPKCMFLTSAANVLFLVSAQEIISEQLSARFEIGRLDL